MNGFLANSIVALEWENGRQLSWILAEDEFELSFTYNDEGIRTSKVSNGTVHYYTLAGDMILSEEWTIGTVQQLILYHYDANGQPIGMSYRRSSYAEGVYDHYLFIKNIQGDITGIIDEEGNLLVTYAYDAWGNHVSTVYSNGGGATGARYNPFRYRGYYYDTETGLYYLNSRYYDPVIGRFLNPDSASYIGADGTLIGYNLFAYCGNNPVMLVDPNGKSPEWWQNLLIVGAGVLLITGLAIATVATGGTAAGVTGAIFAGALKGALIGAAAGTVAGGAIGYAVDGIDGMLTGMSIGFTGGAVVGAIIGGTIGGVNYSPLRAASNAAKRAVPDKNFNINKHLSTAGGRYSKFNMDSCDDIVGTVQKALKSNNVTFGPNPPHANSWSVYVDMGTQIGTKGQRIVKVIIGYGGKIWTMLPK